MTKYYAVKRGREEGIYLTWEACKEQVNGYPEAIYKAFNSKQEAMRYMGKPVKTSRKVKLYLYIKETKISRLCFGIIAYEGIADDQFAYRDYQPVRKYFPMYSPDIDAVFDSLRHACDYSHENGFRDIKVFSNVNLYDECERVSSLYKKIKMYQANPLTKTDKKLFELVSFVANI